MADLNFDIWRMQAQGDVRGLINLLRHASPDIRRRTATALRAVGATTAIPALQTALVTEADATVRIILVSALDDLFKQTPDGDNKEALDHQHKVVYWISQLSSPNEEHIIRAAQNLADLKESLAAEALILVFRNPKHSARIRLAAAEALIKLESAPVEATLLAALRNPDWHTRRNAAGVLGQLHADWAVEALSAALRDPQEVVRRTAYAALKRIDTPEAQRAIETPTSVGSKTATSEHAVVPFFQTVAKVSQTQEIPRLLVQERTKTAEMHSAVDAPPRVEPTATAEISSTVVPAPVAAPDAAKDARAPQAEVEAKPPDDAPPNPSPELAALQEIALSVEPIAPVVAASEVTATPVAAPDTATDAPAPQAEVNSNPPAPNPEPVPSAEVIAPVVPETTAALAPAHATVDEDTQPIEPIRDEDVC